MRIHLLATCAWVRSRVCNPSRSTGEGRGGTLATWEGSVGLAGMDHSTKSTYVESAALSTLHLQPIKICWITLNCTHGPTRQCDSGCSLLGNYIIFTATACDEPGMTAVCRSGLTRHEYMREMGALCNLTPPQPPVRHSTSQVPPPNHSRMAWYLLCCSIHTLSASSTPSAAPPSTHTTP